MKKLSIKKEHKSYGNIYFRYEGKITEDEAQTLQEEAGFHPAGYSFSSFKSKDNVTTWSCLNCCD